MPKEKHSPQAIQDPDFDHDNAELEDRSEDDSGSHGQDSQDESADLNLEAGPSATKVVNPLSPEELAKFQAAQERAGIIYLSRIPPGMRPTKVRHLMSAYGEVGRVYLQQEGGFLLNSIFVAHQLSPAW